MAVNGQVVIKPMMYLAVSYDHRIIDGRESVSFLVKVKQMLENPVLLLFGGKKIPELMRGLGKGIREFNNARNSIESEIKEGMRESERKAIEETKKEA